ncbi:MULTISPECIES: ABC transporter permease [Paenibacillus]|uniref:ABC transporter permease n=1 Tax=Paenibacillus taichungensis TaxID=484184 RepID=A0A329R4B5_9BACL|nr:MULTISPECIES: ABC transporter permease [Paenibacillus]NEU61506.1 ABC transporter permease [Paenibacillus sp. ALJ109b]MCZ1263601.1 ABC transporter permease [Paenibacillus tundrae]OAX50405.1 Nickel transport system permease protein NikB [Paenibacillus sp. AD87]RAW19193.1 ABC transporter permease [Paenibacillus taichungensis]WDQ35008.1 ABC transporter permease [Paenibacillus marchantiae]
MNNYIVRRIAQAIPLLFVISIVSFTLIKLAPGDPVLSFVTPNMGAEDVERIRQNLGLDQPMYVQYVVWLKNVLSGDLGYSLVNHRPVAEMIVERLPATFGLMGASLLLSLLISIPLSMIAGSRQNSLFDRGLSLISYIGISIPSFWFGMMLIYFFAVELHWLPSMGMRTVGMDSAWDIIKHGILPCTVLTFMNVSVYMRYIRSNTISQLEEDYVQIQYAYGATKGTVLLRHVLKNVLLPVITILGMSLPELIAGAFITESVFSWPGMGSLGISAVHGLDYPIIMGITMMSSVLLVVGNLVADILYGVVDPRIKTTG